MDLRREYIVKANNIEAFIRGTFDYFNGRINSHRATLTVAWHDYYLNDVITYGVTAFHHITVYPLTSIKMATTESDIYADLLETVIHELFHVDQLIHWPNVNQDLIEYTAQFMTAAYLLNNRKNLENLFGITIPNKFVTRWVSDIRDNYDCGLYKRATDLDYIFSMIYKFSTAVDGYEKIVFDIYNNIKSNRGIYTIKISINGSDVFPIIDNTISQDGITLLDDIMSTILCYDMVAVKEFDCICTSPSPNVYNVHVIFNILKAYDIIDVLRS